MNDKPVNCCRLYDVRRFLEGLHKKYPEYSGYHGFFFDPEKGKLVLRIAENDYLPKASLEYPLDERDEEDSFDLFAAFIDSNLLMCQC